VTHDEASGGVPTAAGSELELHIERMAHEGVAVGRADGFVHFVEDAAPGDHLRVRVTERKRSFARAEIVEILSPSAERVVPRCPYVGRCGGCHLQHLSGSAQLESRELILRDSLTRLGGISNPTVDPTIARERWGTRHRMTLHASTAGGSRTVVGFVDRSLRHLVPIETCVISHDVFVPVLRALQDLARKEPAFPISDGDIELRTGYPAGLVHAFFDEGTAPLAQPLLNAVQCASETTRLSVHWPEGGTWRKASTHRPEPLVVESPWATWRVPPGVFYQVYPALAIEMAKLVREVAALDDDDIAVDLYSGIGFLAAPLARDAKRVVCLEASMPAVRVGERACAEAGLSNVSFLRGPVERTIRDVPPSPTPAVVVLDPPRTGATRPVLEGILRLDPDRIVYVSCEPSTLARDLRHLIEGGYEHRRSVPFDFFPQTYHFESVTLLSRKPRA